MASAALSPTQDNRQFSVTSPLGKDVLLFRSMTSSEELGRLFTIKLELLSTEENICVDDILGQSMTVHIEAGDETRYFNGVVSSFTHLGSTGSYARYGAILRPWLWLLTRTADCRVFPDNTKSQELTIPEIIKEVFSEHGFPVVADELNGEYCKVGYCVQYRETDFNFVSRLMEQEGIYYFFRHEEDKHTLVLADSPSSHEAISGYEEVPYYPAAAADADDDHINEWLTTCEVQTGTYALNDFDFEKPRADLKTKQNINRDHCRAEFELYDYPGGYLVTGDGDICARRRIEELQVNNQVFRGGGNVRGLSVGGLFSLTKFPRDDQNREYLVKSTSITAQSNAYETTSAHETESFHCRFVALDGQTQFRPRRITAKPVIQGPQTAIVVGKSGEEIWTDKHGRAKVQFHWDRYGKQDENSSCWVRISQAWAGKGWGGIHLPRIGQEVIVEFLEGDPDQPIITGRVYNGDNKVPYDLPANQTQSGLQSRSTKEGSADNFNQLRFEDKKGEEEVYIHAEKDEKIEVENDKNESVGNNETISIGNDRTETVGNDETRTIGNDETITVNNNRTETVMANETLTVQQDRTRTVNKNETVTVALTRTHTVGVNEAITVGVAQEVTVGGFRALTVGAYQNTEIALNHSESIGNNYSLDVGDSRTADVGNDDSLTVGKKLTITAGDEISIITGDASIIMKSDGTITIKGKDITVEGSGEILVKATKDLILKGKKILQN